MRLGLDLGGACAYIARRMNRLFLALIALFTGLAALALPAHARMGSDTEVGSVQNARGAARPATGQPVQTDAPPVRTERRERGTNGRVRPNRSRVFLPPVYHFGDRLLE